jgi:hypothetical protein
VLLDLKKDRTQLFRSPFFLEYKPQRSFVQAAVREVFVGYKDFMTSTEHDADVFFVLLKDLYGLQWAPSSTS